jgi:hypothetical protein
MVQRDTAVSRKIGLVIGLLLSLAYAGSASAHGGGPGLDYDPCAQRVGLDYVHMTAYQPQLNWFQEYCGTIPAGGVTLFVFDLIGAEIRHTPVGIDLVEHGGRTGSVHLASIPFVEHVSGVINFSVPLQTGHTYQAVVTVGGAPTSHTLTFPISVNSWWNGLEIPGLLVLAVLWGCIYYSLRLRREHLAAMRKIEMRIHIRAVGSASDLLTSDALA